MSAAAASGSDTASSPKGPLLNVELSPPVVTMFRLSQLQLDVIADIKARWNKKGFIKNNPKRAGFVDYAQAFEEGSGYPAEAMDSVRQNFTCLLQREHKTFGNKHNEVYADNLIAYIARCYSTSSHVLLLGFDSRSGTQTLDTAGKAKLQSDRIGLIVSVMGAFGFRCKTMGSKVEDRMHYWWSWEVEAGHGRDNTPRHTEAEPYPSIPMQSAKEVLPLRFSVDLRIFYDKAYNEQDEALKMRTLDIYCSVRRWNACTPNLNQIALAWCAPVFFDKFLTLVKETIDLNCARCANKGMFRPDPDVSEDRKRTPSNIAFYKFFDLNESLLVNPE